MELRLSQVTEDGVWTMVVAGWWRKIAQFGYDLKVELEIFACEFNTEHERREREKVIGDFKDFGLSSKLGVIY